MILSKTSIPTGHASLQALQVVHDQIAAGSTRAASLGAIDAVGNFPRFARMKGEHDVTRLQRLAGSGPAGQTALQRPQVVQASVCRKVAPRHVVQRDAPGGGEFPSLARRTGAARPACDPNARSLARRSREHVREESPGERLAKNPMHNAACPPQTQRCRCAAASPLNPSRRSPPATKYPITLQRSNAGRSIAIRAPSSTNPVAAIASNSHASVATSCRCRMCC